MTSVTAWMRLARAVFSSAPQRERGIAILIVIVDGSGERFRRSSILLQRSGDDAGAERFGEKQTSPARAPTFRHTRCGLMTPVTA